MTHQPPVPQWPSVPPASSPQPPAGHAYPGGQHPGAAPRPVSYPPPVRVEAVPGTPYGLAVLAAPRTASGVAASALVTGVGSVLVSLVVWCFGLAGAQQGWGGLVAGAFAALAILLGAAGIVLGWLGMRQIRLAAGAMTGRGVAVSGLVCGIVGFVLAAAGLITAIILSAG